MRYLLLALGLFTLLVPESRAQSRQGIGIGLFPNYSHRRLVVFQNYSQNQVDSLETAERFRPSYSAGLLLSTRGEKVGLQIGLNYAEVGYRGTRTPLPITDPRANRFTEYRLEFRGRQVMVPLSILFYQELSEQDEFYFLLGSGLSYSLKNDFVTTYFSGDISEREVAEAPGEFRRINYCFEAAMGWEHHFGGKLTLTLAPTFRLWMSGLLTEGELNRNLYQLGMRMGLRMDWERGR